MMMHLGAQVAVAVVDNADEQHDEVSRAVRDERLGHETMNHDAARDEPWSARARRREHETTRRNPTKEPKRASERGVRARGERERQRAGPGARPSSVDTATACKHGSVSRRRSPRRATITTRRGDDDHRTRARRRSTQPASLSPVLHATSTRRRQRPRLSSETRSGTLARFFHTGGAQAQALSCSPRANDVRGRKLAVFAASSRG